MWAEQYWGQLDTLPGGGRKQGGILRDKGLQRVMFLEKDDTNLIWALLADISWTTIFFCMSISPRSMRTSQSACGILGTDVCKELGKIFSHLFVFWSPVPCRNLRTQITSNQEGFSFLLAPAEGIPSPSWLQWRKKDNSKRRWIVIIVKCYLPSHTVLLEKQSLGEENNFFSFNRMAEIDSKRRNSSCQQAEYLSTAGEEKWTAIVSSQPGNCHMIITGLGAADSNWWSRCERLHVSLSALW